MPSRHELRGLINDLGFGDRSKLNPVVPSLYRHFIAWPGYLAALHVTLMPRFRDGSLAKATQDLRQAMDREAAPIAAYLPPLRRLAAIPELIDTVAQFSATLIPLMVVVGHAMRESLT